MNRRLLLGFVCLLLALGAATLWVPVEHGTNFKVEEHDETRYVRFTQEWSNFHDGRVYRWCWVWERRAAVFAPPPRALPPLVVPAGAETYEGERVVWTIVLGAHALLVVLGAGLLVWNERRRRHGRRALIDGPRAIAALATLIALTVALRWTPKRERNPYGPSTGSIVWRSAWEPTHVWLPRAGGDRKLVGFEVASAACVAQLVAVGLLGGLLVVWTERRRRRGGPD